MALDVRPFVVELTTRIDTIRRLVVAAHASGSASPDITREARGLAVLLLFAAYENLLTSLCRGVLEAAAKLRVGNRRLKTGLRVFAVYSDLQAIANASDRKIWQEGPRLMATAAQSRGCTLNTNAFPADGSFMKSSQVRLVCDLFDLGDPGPILKEVWSRLDTVVTERNHIAHGKSTPEEIGRNYSLADINTLVDLWEKRWSEFLQHVGTQAASRDFFRHAR